MSRIPFHRPVRAMPPTLEAQRITLPSPPQDQQASNASMWLTLLLPLMSSVTMASYMIIYHNTMLIILGIAFVLFAVAATVFARYQMKHSAKLSKSSQQRRYMRFLASVKSSAREVAAAQRLVAAWVHPSPERLWSIARRRRRVWERRNTDDDFLWVRLGLGRGELASAIQFGGQNDPLAEYDEKDAADKKVYAEARAVVNRFGTVGRQPALVDLANAGVVSILGPTDQARAVARSLVCQVSVLHAPDDVGVAVYTAGDESWNWAKWLPNTYEPEMAGTAGVVPLVAADVDDLADALEAALRRADDDRVSRSRATTQPRRGTPNSRLIVVLDSYDPRAEWVDTPIISALLKYAGPELGITVVCVVGHERDEPTRSQVRVRVTDGGALSLEGRRPQLFSQVTDAVADRPQPALCELIARALAPLNLSNEPDRVLTRIAPLMEMLGAADLATFDPTRAWRRPDDSRVLRVPIGIAGDGDIVELDLKESAQDGMGPHGLIVGATGSGKSELLRTLVTGLVMTHSPELLSLVLVDFKGGATFAGLTELPHVAGLITNLADDLSLVDRVRDALHGEQQRRQKMLRDAGNVDSLREYQLRQAAGHTDVNGRPLEPLPYLLVIVDEFGELLSQRSDFTDLFVQIGRVGRSLGMHLLLASQRLDEGRLRGLESHLSYRVCLRTFSSQESRAVIGTTDAYQLPPVPGSAYLKVDESVYRRFRVAHVSGPYESAEDIARRDSSGPVPVAEFGLRTWSSLIPPETVAATAATVGGPTAMQVAVGRLCRYGEPVHQVWLPPLPSVIPLDALLGPTAAHPRRGWQASMWPGQGELTVPIGLIDLPLRQQQQPLILDFTHKHGNIALVGAPQSGKSTLLRSLVLGLLLTNTPEEAHVYCVDFGGGSLFPFSRAPHVAAVAGRRDIDLTRRILLETKRIVAAREQLFAELGVDAAAGFRGLRRAGRLAPDVDAADVFLVIDNWGAVRGELEDAESILVEIASRGLGVGVHVVLASPRWAEIRMVLRDSFSTRLELRLNDPTESEVSRPFAKQLADAPAGRGIVAPGVIYHTLAPRLDGRESFDDITDALDETLGKLAVSWTGPVPEPVRLLPTRVSVSEMAGVDPDAAGVPIGLGDHTLEPVHLDLEADDPHFLVFGDAGAGKSTFLRTWLTGMVARRSSWDARFMIVDYRRSLLDVLPEDYIGAYAPDPGAAESYANALVERLAERMPPPGISARELRERAWWSGPELYLVVDDYDLVSGARQSPLAAVANYIPQASDIGLHVVLARRVAGASRALMSDTLITRIKELGTAGLLLSGDTREGVLLGDEKARQLPPGRGVLVRRQAPPTLVQVADHEAATSLDASAVA